MKSIAYFIHKFEVSIFKTVVSSGQPMDDNDAHDTETETDNKYNRQFMIA